MHNFFFVILLFNNYFIPKIVKIGIILVYLRREIIKIGII